MKVLSLVLTVVAGALATPEGGGYGSQGPGGRGGQDPTAQYSFQWDVDHPPSGNFYGHQEQRDGAVTRGSYYVRLPDGRLLRVRYTVDETGYQPVLNYEGEAKYPPHPPRSSTLPGTPPLPQLAPSGGTTTVSGVSSSPPPSPHSTPGAIPGHLPPPHNNLAAPPDTTKNNLPSARPDLTSAPIPPPGLSAPSSFPGTWVLPTGPRPPAYIPVHPPGANPEEVSTLSFAQPTSFNVAMRTIPPHLFPPAAHSTQKLDSITSSSLSTRHPAQKSNKIPSISLPQTKHSTQKPNKVSPIFFSPKKRSTQKPHKVPPTFFPLIKHFSQKSDTFSLIPFLPKKQSTHKPNLFLASSHKTDAVTSSSDPPRYHAIHYSADEPPPPLLPQRNESNFELTSLPPRAPPHAVPPQDDSIYRQTLLPENHSQQSILPRRPTPPADRFTSGINTLFSVPLPQAGGSSRLKAPPVPEYNLFLLAEAVTLFPDGNL